jgi:hypothetical protein
MLYLFIVSCILWHECILLLVKLTIQLHPVSILIILGAVPLLPLTSLFIYGLLNHAISSSDCIVSNDKWIMNLKGYGRKQSSPNLRYYPGFCLMDVKKTTKRLSNDSQSLSQDRNRGPPEYKALGRHCHTSSWHSSWVEALLSVHLTS